MPKISDLSAASALSGTEALPAVQSSTTKKTTPADIATYVKSGLVKGDVGLGNVTNVAQAAAGDIASSGLTTPTSTILGRATAATGAVEELTPSQTKTLLSLTKSDVGLGNVTNVAQAAAGDIASSGLTTPTNKILGRVTAATGAVEELTAAQTKTLLAIAAGDVSGLATVATSGSASDLTTGTLPVAQLPVRGISGFCSGKPGSSETVVGAVAPYSFSITQANCVSKASVAATASTTFTIKNNGSSIGTIVYAISGTSGTVTITTAAVSAGDLITISAPGTADSTLADISFLLKA